MVSIWAAKLRERNDIVLRKETGMFAKAQKEAAFKHNGLPHFISYLDTVAEQIVHEYKHL